MTSQACFKCGGIIASGTMGFYGTICKCHFGPAMAITSEVKYVEYDVYLAEKKRADEAELVHTNYKLNVVKSLYNGPLIIELEEQLTAANARIGDLEFKLKIADSIICRFESIIQEQTKDK